MAYSTRAQIEARFGTSNVTAWADLNNNGNAGEITARIEDAIAAADAQIDDRLRGGPYAVPFDAETLPRTIREIAVALAGVWLYEARGTDQQDGQGRPVHKLAAAKAEAELRLTMILDGRLRLDLERVTTEVPVVVADTYTEPSDITEPPWE